MKVIKTNINDAILFEPNIYEDERGYFFESWNLNKFKPYLKDNANFVQDNHSFSKKNVIRGLHYQLNKPQGKLIRVVRGSILDVIVDLRKNSSTFKKFFSVILSSENRKIFWVPPGCAHGFKVNENANVLYKTTSFYSPLDERCIKWNDPELGIDWKLSKDPILSKKDQLGLTFLEAEIFE